METNELRKNYEDLKKSFTDGKDNGFLRYLKLKLSALKVLSKINMDNEYVILHKDFPYNDNSLSISYTYCNEKIPDISISIEFSLLPKSYSKEDIDKLTIYVGKLRDEFSKVITFKEYRETLENIYTNYLDFFRCEDEQIKQYNISK
jgi:hypothetical protein